MKATDLMIGDYLQYNGMPYRVIQVTGLSSGGTFMLENGEEDCGEPIPLTKEILEKNGWSCAEFRGGYGRKGIRLNGLDELPEGVDNALDFAQWSLDTKFLYHHLEIYMWKGSVHLWVNYVHELQHAFRMCGITKDIEL